MKEQHPQHFAHRASQTDADASENQKIIDSYDYLGKACSVMDCTGLIPSRPVSESEWESYESLYPYLPPVVSQATEPRRQDSDLS